MRARSLVHPGPSGRITVRTGQQDEQALQLRDVAREDAALRDDEPVGFDVAAHAASRRDLHLAGGDQRALVDALDDGVDGALVGFAVAVIVAGVVLGLIGRTIGKR